MAYQQCIHQYQKLIPVATIHPVNLTSTYQLQWNYVFFFIFSYTDGKFSNKYGLLLPEYLWPTSVNKIVRLNGVDSLGLSS